MINCAMNNRTLKSSKFFHLFPTKLEMFNQSDFYNQ